MEANPAIPLKNLPLPLGLLWSTGISSVSERGGGEPALQWKEGVEGEGASRG